jgi:hypothetical protein
VAAEGDRKAALGEAFVHSLTETARADDADRSKHGSSSEGIPGTP